MKLITDKIEGDITIIEDTNINGMVIGTITVSENVTLIIHGMIIGNIILRKNSTLFHYGFADGNIKNIEADLEVFGTVNGEIITENGKTSIDSNARVIKPLR